MRPNRERATDRLRSRRWVNGPRTANPSWHGGDQCHRTLRGSPGRNGSRPGDFEDSAVTLKTALAAVRVVRGTGDAETVAGLAGRSAVTDVVKPLGPAPDVGSYRGQAAGVTGFEAELLDAVGQAVIATDPAGTVVYWNRAAEQL
jgi:PAS domain-containing protein